EQRVLPQVKRAELDAIKLVPGAADDPLLKMHASRRDEERVKKAVETYGEAETTLRPAADLLRRSGPYRDAVVEEARLKRLELIEARLDLFALNKRCLEAGKDWPQEDEKKREAAIKRVADLEQEWIKLVR